MTDYVAWTVNDLLTALKEKRLRLPEYQRRGVWDELKQASLITSLRKGWPIGSLLLTGDPFKSGASHLLVDGQQRVTAIRCFIDSPFKYIKPHDIDPHLRSPIEALVENSSKNTAAKQDIYGSVNLALQAWLDSCERFGEQDTIANLTLILEERLALPMKKELLKAAEALVKGVEKSWDIGEKRVALVFFRGDIDDIPLIFEKINTEGRRLDKFEIYAAKWFAEGTTVHITNKKIIHRIQQSYEKQIERGMVFETSPGEPPYMLVEYLFGLGKELCNGFPLLFGGSQKDSDVTHEVGFNVAATAHRLRIGVKEMGTLNGRMRETAKTKDGEIDPSLFETALLESVDFVNDVLKPFLSIRLNRKKEPEILHNTSHVISFVCRALNARYDEKFKQRAGFKQERDRLRKTIPHFYLEGILGERWSGAAADSLWNAVWSGSSADNKSLKPSGQYLEIRDRAHWERVLTNYHANTKLKNRTEGRYIQKHHKVFLKYLISRSLTNYDNTATYFEIEHLFPVARLEALIKKDKKHPSGWPIDATANLAVFEKKLNRKKKESTLKEYMEGLNAKHRKKIEMQKLGWLMCDWRDVSIPKSGAHDKLTLEQYAKFLDNRFEPMREAVLEALGF